MKRDTSTFNKGIQQGFLMRPTFDVDGSLAKPSIGRHSKGTFELRFNDISKVF